jgi:diguanylate cyclase (GGDEF)-like protein
VTVALIDLDHFKPINDTFGHLVGDALLAEAARRMASLVPDDGLLCRIGGDEFAVIFERQSRTTVDYVAKAIITAMKETFSVSGCSLHIGATIGMASAPDDTANPETLLRYADLALYAAKADRRARCAASCATWTSPRRKRACWRPISGRRSGWANWRSTISR